MPSTYPEATDMRIFRLLASALITFQLIGCASGKLHRVDIEGNEVQTKWLETIEDGITTREEILLKFGIPSAQFEGERILTYKMVLLSKKESLVYQGKTSVRTGKKPAGTEESDSEEETLMVVAQELDSRQVFKMWRIAQYNLILVFDETGLLEKHSLIQVR